MNHGQRLRPRSRRSARVGEFYKKEFCHICDRFAVPSGRLGETGRPSSARAALCDVCMMEIGGLGPGQGAWFDWCQSCMTRHKCNYRLAGTSSLCKKAVDAITKGPAREVVVAAPPPAALPRRRARQAAPPPLPRPGAKKRTPRERVARNYRSGTSFEHRWLNGLKASGAAASGSRYTGSEGPPWKRDYDRMNTAGTDWAVIPAPVDVCWRTADGTVHEDQLKIGTGRVGVPSTAEFLRLVMYAWDKDGQIIVSLVSKEKRSHKTHVWTFHNRTVNDANDA